MSNYRLNEADTNYKQVDGTPFVNAEVNIDGGTSIALGTAVASGSVMTDLVEFGIDRVDGIFGSTVLQSNEIFGAFHITPVTITSVADDSGTCVFTLNTHGLTAGTVINITGSTSGNVDGVQTITAVTANTFDTDKVYTASATAGLYATVAGTFATMTAGEYVQRGYRQVIAGGQYTYTGFGSDFGIRRSIHKLESLYTRRVATAIRAGYWNVFTGEFSTEPTVADDLPDMETGSGLGTGDEAATPTRLDPGHLVYRVSGQPDGTFGPIVDQYSAKTS